MASFMYPSCLSKTITIDDDVYKLLASLKQNHGDSFTKVLRRHVHKPAETAGELLDACENEAPHRREIIRTTIISLAEVATGFQSSAAAWDYFKWWKIYPLHRGIAEAAADVDRELAAVGQRLGENDNWIAGFCRFYREPVISADVAFDRVTLLRRILY
jgi:predicted CopG family antitoxin